MYTVTKSPLVTVTKDTPVVMEATEQVLSSQVVVLRTVVATCGSFAVSTGPDSEFGEGKEVEWPAMISPLVTVVAVNPVVTGAVLHLSHEVVEITAVGISVLVSTLVAVTDTVSLVARELDLDEKLLKGEL